MHTSMYACRCVYVSMRVYVYVCMKVCTFGMRYSQFVILYLFIYVWTSRGHVIDVLCGFHLIVHVIIIVARYQGFLCLSNTSMHADDGKNRHIDVQRDVPSHYHWFLDFLMDAILHKLFVLHIRASSESIV